MRIAKRKHRDLALHVGAVTRSDNIELACKPGGNTLDRICRQRPRQSMKRGKLVAFANEFRWSSFCSILIPAGMGTAVYPSALRPQVFADIDLDALGQRESASFLLVTCAFFPYQIWQRTSPPTPSLRAAPPVITPFGVVRMLMPRPPRMRGISLLPT